MRRIPADTTQVRCVPTGNDAARATYTELSDGSRTRVPDQQDTDDQGHPGWTLNRRPDDPDADLAPRSAPATSTAGRSANFMLGQEIKFIGLTAPPYVTQGTNGVALSAAAEGFEIEASPAWQAAGGLTRRAANTASPHARIPASSTDSPPWPQ